jgi:hypothetical protein
MFRNVWTNRTGCFRLTAPVRVVRTGATGAPELVVIAPGSLVAVTGKSSIPGFVEISLGGQPYNIFYRELKKNAERV